uniref:Uncharacterized protein n=1 Tax=Anguilla anguilla TaxID=7936 RepID=A0A0E9TVW5_ANGAN
MTAEQRNAWVTPSTRFEANDFRFSKHTLPLSI